MLFSIYLICIFICSQFLFAESSSFQRGCNDPHACNYDSQSNDNSSCDDWHSTHVHNIGQSTRGYMHWGDFNHATRKMWGCTYGTGTDPNTYSGTVWSRPDVAGSAGGTEVNYGRSDGDREMGMSYWVRNKGTW